MVALTTRHLIYPATLPPPVLPPATPPPSLKAIEEEASTIKTKNEYLSVLSYNVLLPNSVDGWWNYKMYLPPLYSSSSSGGGGGGEDPTDTMEDISSWDYRRNLLRERIGLIDADVVCFQEVSPLSFEEDFAFMKDDLGYDQCELFKKGRFRPATFWKTSKCDLVAPAVHKDRTLLTAFRVKGDEEGNTKVPSAVASAAAAAAEKQEVDSNSGNENQAKGSTKKGQNKKKLTQQEKETYWYVLNCHLQAGKQGGRRVRQIHEGMRAVFTLAKKMKEPDPKSPNLIVCGDFNGGSECGAINYIEKGSIDPEFIEDGESVTSKVKESPFSQPLLDAMNVAEIKRKGEGGEESASPPPTLVVPELISLLVEMNSEEDGFDIKTAYENPSLSKDAKERLERVYYKYATTCSSPSSEEAKAMCTFDVEKWLIDINGKVGRGSEFRTAAKEMGWVDPSPSNSGSDSEGGGGKKEKPRIVLPEEGILTLEGFINVYEDELRQGKFWGIAHDLAVMGEPLPDAGVFESRYDRMYCSPSLHPSAVLDTISTVPCPNKDEPSDHLPLAACFIKR